MNQNAPCPTCGKHLPEDAPMGVCPNCLMSAGLGTVTVADEEGAPKLRTFEPPLPEEIAARFPQLEIIELLGRGGMGAVYKARQTELDRTVALKILPPGIGDEPGFAERFAREAKALAKLNHPGIVTIHDFGRADGLFYFLMEFVDGVNLRQLLQGDRIAPREALAIVPQICDALQFAHDHGIVHRDIKPENILMDRRGRVKVADFGIAKLTGAGEQPGTGGEAARSAFTEAGRVIGTPSYMAPEQASHPADVDHRADIYALGVVFYQMLTGELPGKRVEAPSSKVRIDVRLDEVVLKALEKKPERRYQQANEMRTGVDTIAAAAIDEERPATSKTNLASARLWTWVGIANCALAISISLWFMTGKAFSLPVAVLFAFALPTLFDLAVMQRSGRSFSRLLTPTRTAIRRWTRWVKPNVSRAGLRVGAVAAAALALLSVGTMAWLQRPQMLEVETYDWAPGRAFNATASTWRAMRIFGDDKIFYRTKVVDKRTSPWTVVKEWDTPHTPLPRPAQPEQGAMSATEYLAKVHEWDVATSQPYLTELLFVRNGKIVWSDNNKRVSFRLGEKELTALNIETGEVTFQGFLPEREVVIKSSSTLQNCFLDLDTGEVVSAPKVWVDSLAAKGQLYDGATPPSILREWMVTSGADLFKGAEFEAETYQEATLGQSSSENIDSWALLQIDGVVAYMSPESFPFDGVSTENILRSIGQIEKVFSEAPKAKGASFFPVQPGLVNAFKTREGRLGVMEVQKEGRNRMRVRYKLLPEGQSELARLP